MQKEIFHSKKVVPGTLLYIETKTLYESSFPAIEQVDFDWMTDQASKGLAEHRAYFDGEAFCGFTISLVSERAVYLLFLAVDPHHHSKGYGSKILREMAEQAKGRPLYLSIEPLDVTASNYAQRMRRLSFYERNAYSLTDYLYYEDQEAYQVMTTQPQAPIEDFVELAMRVEGSGMAIRVAQQEK
ncbi:ribosomal protein S18 acetylase RimI-like enzyme [Streptococcus rupicaprae]|uniref:Ribosomal protein S18 acetylase RimI-like enzyme n=1 Tax=Streptococcus rupicaprae TaxID=759619 RepID=A0ABV2FGV3_9STRE